MGLLRKIGRMLAGRESADQKILQKFYSARIEEEFTLSVDRTGAPLDLLRSIDAYMIRSPIEERCPARWDSVGITDERVVLIGMMVRYTHKESLAIIHALDGGSLEPCADNATMWTLLKHHSDVDMYDPGTIWRTTSGERGALASSHSEGDLYMEVFRFKGWWLRPGFILARRKEPVHVR